MRERRREYELVIIISPLISNEEGITASLDRLRQTIETNGGAITGINQGSPWGRRKLAYPIREYVSGEASRRSFSDGYYALINFTLGAAKVAELERTIRLTDTILRHLITVIEPKASKTPPAESAEPIAQKSEA